MEMYVSKTKENGSCTPVATLMRGLAYRIACMLVKCHLSNVISGRIGFCNIRNLSPDTDVHQWGLSGQTRNVAHKEQL